MNKVNINVSAPNLAVICIDTVKAESFLGRLYHKYHEDSIKFYDIGQLLPELDRLCDQSGYPQKATVDRTFRKQGFSASRKEALQVADVDQILNQSGGLATFVVHIKYRQHSTWQGEVVWAEKNQKQTFRSALELMKLIDGAINQEELT